MPSRVHEERGNCEDLEIVLAYPRRLVDTAYEGKQLEVQRENMERWVAM